MDLKFGRIQRAQELMKEQSMIGLMIMHYADYRYFFGDILIHTGDLTRHGTLDDEREFNEFLGALPHTHKTVIAGNHDLCI